MMITIKGIPTIKTEGPEGNTFDLLPRRGEHSPSNVESAIAYIRENYSKVKNIEATWLPRLPHASTDYSKVPCVMFRTQLITGTLSPYKRAVWGTIEFGGYEFTVGLYDGAPEPINLLSAPRVTFSDGKFRYITTGEELAFVLNADKTIEKKKLK
jgi:hypothetical protein